MQNKVTQIRPELLFYMLYHPLSEKKKLAAGLCIPATTLRALHTSYLVNKTVVKFVTVAHVKDSSFCFIEPSIEAMGHMCCYIVLK